MKNLIGRVSKGIVTMSRRRKRIVLSTIDGVAFLATLWALISLRYWQPFWPDNHLTLALMLAAPLITVGLLLIYRVYNEVTRFVGIGGGFKLIYVIGIATLLWATLVLMLGQSGIPRSVMVLYAIAAPMVAIFIRSSASAMLRSAGVPVPDRSRDKPPIPVAIYGAGHLGIQLSQSLSRNSTRSLVAFIDPAPGLVGRTIDGVRVYHPDRLGELIPRYQVEEVVLAIDDITASERLAILKSLETNKVRVRILPELEAFSSGRVKVSDIRGIDGIDLLGREPVPADRGLLEHAINGKSVMVTGAGGSIGSEIARQVVQLSPKVVVLVDNSEIALFNIEQHIQDALAAPRHDVDDVARSTDNATAADVASPPKVIAILASVHDRSSMQEAMAANGVQTVFHAAAYKHVPMIERNPASGIVNNIFATQSLATLAIDQGIERFVFVSTDKAVRPTNVMGASKRVAELVIHDLAQDGTQTNFCCVRFGNVLGSSGSVVQKFVEQIRAGGPVTVTSPDMVRYFMSVQEAASLVIQAGSLSQGGETFLLDMGEPIKIDDMARSMIRLMGYIERTPETPNGQIEIVYTGARPGEKLVEELLVVPESSMPTGHPRIMRSLEPGVERDLLHTELENMSRAVKMRDSGFLVASLKKLVSGYEPSESVLKTVDGPSGTTPLN